MSEKRHCVVPKLSRRGSGKGKIDGRGKGGLGGKTHSVILVQAPRDFSQSGGFEESGTHTTPEMTPRKRNNLPSSSSFSLLAFSRGNFILIKLPLRLLYFLSSGALELLTNEDSIVRVKKLGDEEGHDYRLKRS